MRGSGVAMKFRNLLSKYGIILVLFALLLIFGIGNKTFFTVSNFITIIRQITVVTIMTIGMSFVLIAGGIDLSVGTQLSFIGVVTATLFTKYGVSPLLACFLGILLATGVGTVNGLFISQTRV